MRRISVLAPVLGRAWGQESRRLLWGEAVTVWTAVVWPFVLSAARKTYRCDLCNETRTLHMRMRDGTLKASLEGPQMSSLTKLVFVASLGCPRHVTCPGGAVVRWLWCRFQFPGLSPSPGLASRSQSGGKQPCFLTSDGYPVLFTEASSQTVGYTWREDNHKVVFTIQQIFWGCRSFILDLLYSLGGL